MIIKKIYKLCWKNTNDWYTNMNTLQELYVELSKSSTKNSYCIVLVIKSSRIGQTNLYWQKKSKCNLHLGEQDGSCWKEI